MRLDLRVEMIGGERDRKWEKWKRGFWEKRRESAV